MNSAPRIFLTVELFHAWRRSGSDRRQSTGEEEGAGAEAASKGTRGREKGGASQMAAGYSPPGCSLLTAVSTAAHIQSILADQPCCRRSLLSNARLTPMIWRICGIESGDVARFCTRASCVLALFIHPPTRKRTHTHTWTHTHSHSHTHTCTHTRASAHTHAHTHAHHSI